MRARDRARDFIYWEKKLYPQAVWAGWSWMNSLKEAQSLPAAISPPAARLRSMAGIHPKQHLAQDLGSRGAFKTSLCAHISPGCEHCFEMCYWSRAGEVDGAMCLYHHREDCLTRTLRDKTLLLTVVEQSCPSLFFFPSYYTSLTEGESENVIPIIPCLCLNIKSFIIRWEQAHRNSSSVYPDIYILVLFPHLKC